MQFHPDPANMYDHNKYLKCPSCGFTKLAKEEILPPVPSDEEIEQKLKEIEDEVLTK